MAIVGGGAAGFAAADTLRKLGGRGVIALFSEEEEQPYDRALLTKDYLEGSFGDERLPIAQHDLADLGVTFHGGVRVDRIDPKARRLRLTNGGEQDYAKLLLATGAAPRRAQFPRSRSSERDDGAHARRLPKNPGQCDLRRQHPGDCGSFIAMEGGGLLARTRAFGRCRRA